MPGKGSDYGGKAVSTVAGAAAAFLARKAIGFAWTKATGREPPAKAEDPNVSLTEALAWTVALAIGVGVIRVLTLRLLSRRLGRELTGSGE